MFRRRPGKFDKGRAVTVDGPTFIDCRHCGAELLTRRGVVHCLTCDGVAGIPIAPTEGEPTT